MYSMTLADGTKVEFEGVNGTNFIVPNKKEMDTSVFTDENLKDVTIKTDEGEELEYHNLAFIQQQKQLDGYYYVCFYEKSEQQIENEAIEETLVQLLSTEIGVGNLEIDDVSVKFKEKVRAKMDADKKLEL